MTSMNEMFPSYTTDASFTKPEAMVVPCIWDNKQKIYVPVYSHRGVEIQNRIEELEAALRKMLEKCTWAKREKWCGSLDCHCQIARKALEGKDD